MPPLPRPKVVGVVAPFDFVPDHELKRWAPDDISIAPTRTPYRPEPVTAEMVKRVGNLDALRACTQELLTAEPEVVVWACTSGSFARGKAAEEEMRATMEAAGAPRAISASSALVTAARTLGIERLAVATPYLGEVTELLPPFLAEHGIEVVGSAGLGLDGDIWKADYTALAQVVCDADRPEAEAVFISCTNFLTYDALPILERHLGKPVLSANQLMMWNAVEAAGSKAVGPGQSILEHTPVAWS